MIGLSLSICCKEILEGKVKLEDVEKIISSTAFVTDEDWETGFEFYHQAGWFKNISKEDAKDMFLNKLKPITEQPRLSTGRRPVKFNRHWVNNEDEIRYQ